MNSDFLAKARALAATGRELHARGWVPATSGNFSMRLSDNSVLVTASGRHKGRLDEQDFLAVDLAGRPIDGGKPSAETLLHTQLYARFPEVNAALHCHTPASTVLTMHRPDSELTFEGYELQKAFAGFSSHESTLSIPVFDNTQDIAALAADVDRYFDRVPDCPAYVIRGHGVYCWGDSLDACHRELEALDFLFQCALEMERLRR
ncbi:methylthioribulose 1-phosphate dehydratase [Litorivivens lipolytica]|uniref:methylthioribulose 1-phosphate dehydratase n=1 Tax=Litorivivens lipolytica TaxID=1524264 RepID=UPI003CCD4B60